MCGSWVSAFIALAAAVGLGALSVIYKPLPNNAFDPPLPPGDNGLPVLGITLELLTQPATPLINKCFNNGTAGVYKTYALGIDTILLCGKKGAQIFYDESRVQRAGGGLSVVAKVLPDNVGNLDDELHKKVKNVILKGTTGKVLSEKGAEINKLIDELMINLESKNGSSFSLAQELKPFNYKVLSTLILGFVDRKPMEQYIAAVAATAAPPIDLPFTEFGKAVANVPKLLDYLESQAKKGASALRGTALGEILQANSKLEKPLSSRRLASELNHLFMAGMIMDIPIIQTLQQLQLHPEILAKARAEARSVTISESGMSPQDLSKFPTLSRILAEVQRLYPLVKFGSGLTRKTFQINDGAGKSYSIPGGIQAIYFISSLGWDKSVWGSDVQSFNPDRFGDGSVNIKELSNGFKISYQGAGFDDKSSTDSGHKCAGVDIATWVVESVLIRLLRNYEWVVNNPTAPMSGDVIGQVSDTGMISKFAKI